METRLKSFTQFTQQFTTISESLQYHITNNLSISESIFRPGSDAHLAMLAEARELYELGKIILDKEDLCLFEETDLGLFGVYHGKKVPLDLVFEDIQLFESNKKSNVKLGKPMRGGSKKYYVYVKNPKTGNTMKIEFGDPGLNAKVSNPKARKSFAARHRCHEKTDRTKAGYWACRINRYAHLWGGKTYPGFW